VTLTMAVSTATVISSSRVIVRVVERRSKVRHQHRAVLACVLALDCVTYTLSEAEVETAAESGSVRDSGRG
jgi:hypothetical protein